ncbi:DUF6443 domain-containing protein [uncultured Chryseobacterium sp.]|uniref:DUF6443 domain-containing protein n=1 Tax=uncultured Chryseobacterium sp. TaxID=259322 RepID=UPI0025F739A3|nr:DUF6443 domain-containing protein [uncultured Chryseobacterium sp.]
MKKLLNILIFFLVFVAIKAQTTTENYIQTKVYLEPVSVTNTTAKQLNTVEYFDGLGRPKQIINVKSTPAGNDLVTPIIYDSYGLQTKKFLPIPKNATSSGNIYSQDSNSPNFPVDDVTNFYQGEKIFSESILEISPLNRIQQRKQEGNDWSSKPVNYKYQTNSTSDAVKKYEVTTSWDTNKNAFINTSPVSQLYEVNQLYKTSVKDEDGNETITFKNKLGQTILSRKVLNPSKNIDTYFVYNIYDQLSYIIPPLAAQALALDDDKIKNLCYQYIYDEKNRIVEKKLPGKEWEYMVYDKQDRLVLSQDTVLKTTTANSFNKKGWLFTKYDQWGRVVYTGFFSNTSSRVAMQNAVNSMTANAGNNETRSTTPFNLNGIDVYYTKNAFPTGSMTILGINYYDTYPVGSPAAPSQIWGQEVLTQSSSNVSVSTNSLSLASYVKNVDDDQWTKTYNWYDKKGRSIATQSLNYLGGYTKTESLLDFTGIVKQNIIKHKRLSNDTEKVITETFLYDNQNRLSVHKHQVDSNPEEILAQNTYNEISQLTSKKVGGTLNNPIQNVDYAYTIRGWLKKINDPANLNGRLFGMELKYNNASNISSSINKYNGNISQVDWKTANDGILRRYTYQYDGLDRMLYAMYSKPDNTVTNTNAYDEALSYDDNGNIIHINRYGGSDGNQAQQIDDIDFTAYNGNKVTSIIDHKNNSLGYPAGGGLTISYDLNGNMIDFKDRNINKITYNYLNLPTKVNMVQGGGFGMSGEGNVIDFKYRADGTKLEKNTNYVNPYSTHLTYVNYLEGFQYKRIYDHVSTSQNPYDSGYLLQFIPTDEGYYDYINNRYIYSYKDQVGNIRVTYYRDGTGAVVIAKESNYYPFGMEHSGYNSGFNQLNTYRKGFQGQENQPETGWSSFKWRNYDPVIGRFLTIDPLSEKYAYQSHYNFSENRVVDAVEIEGLEAYTLNDGNISLNGYDLTMDEYTKREDGDIDIKAVDLSRNVSDASMGEDINNENLSWLGIQDIDRYHDSLSYLENAVQNDKGARQIGEFEKALFIGVPLTLATGGAGGFALSGEMGVAAGGRFLTDASVQAAANYTTNGGDIGKALTNINLTQSALAGAGMNYIGNAVISTAVNINIADSKSVFTGGVSARTYVTQAGLSIVGGAAVNGITGSSVFKSIVIGSYMSTTSSFGQTAGTAVANVLMNTPDYTRATLQNKVP